MIASLPMYPADRDAVGALWDALSSILTDMGVSGLPAQLLWPDDLHAHWRRPDLLLSQTCGYPLVTGLADDVHVVGTFHYTAPYCDGPNYRSVVIARADDGREDLRLFRGCRVAYNSRDSQSGYNGFRALVAPLAINGRLFGEAIATGSHHASMRAVAGGQADVAAVDCISFTAIGRQELGLVAALKVIGLTELAPGLPLITPKSNGAGLVGILRTTLGQLVADPGLADIRQRLMIKAFTPLELADYAPIRRMEQAAFAAGYPDLA